MRLRRETVPTHRFAGYDRFGYSCMAKCECGWDSGLTPAEDRALVSFATHRVTAWFRRTRVT